MMPGAVCSKSEDGVVIFWCPGCETYHGVWTEEPNSQTGAKWTWNHSRHKPTFSPSILVHQGSNTPRCHSFVQDGIIKFLPDCDHKLAGQEVRLPTESEITVRITESPSKPSWPPGSYKKEASLF